MKTRPGRQKAHGETSHTAVSQLRPACSPGLHPQEQQKQASDAEKEVLSQGPPSITRIQGAPLESQGHEVSTSPQAVISAAPRKGQQNPSTRELPGKSL